MLAREGRRGGAVGRREGNGTGRTLDHSGWCFFTAHSDAIVFMNSYFHISASCSSSICYISSSDIIIGNIGCEDMNTRVKMKMKMRVRETNPGLLKRLELKTPLHSFPARDQSPFPTIYF